MSKSPRKIEEPTPKAKASEDDPKIFPSDAIEFFKALSTQQKDQIMNTIINDRDLFERFYQIMVNTRIISPSSDGDLPEATRFFHFLRLYRG